MANTIHSYDAYSIALRKAVSNELEKIGYKQKYSPTTTVVQMPDKDYKYQAKVILFEVVFNSNYFDEPTDAMSDVMCKVRNLKTTHPELFL
jgi:hypothetical protein